jgi:hypothetical protein
MRHQFLGFLCALALWVGASTAAQAVTVFSSEAAYNAAVGNQLFFINFNGSPAGGQLSNGSFNPGISFGSPEASNPSAVFWNDNAITDAGSTTFFTGVGPMSGVFTDPVSAFGLIFSSAAELETIKLYNELNTLIDTVQAVNANGFFGVLSGTPIQRFIIEQGIFPETQGRDRFFVDDFRANEPGVNEPLIPEPMTIILMGAGSAMLGLSQRKRNKRSLIEAKSTFSFFL